MIRSAITFPLFMAGLVACAESVAQPPVFNDAVNIDQQQLTSGGYTLSEVLRSGERFFAAPFQPSDGWGEGPEGPRAFQRKVLYPYYADFPFLRVNGIDSQSCFECHLSIGVSAGPDDRLLRRKSGATGGAAGIASNALINDEFPTRLTKFVRNPPHAFGSGYIEELAGEISLDLKAQRLVARTAAEADPGVTKSIHLESKGINYGVFRTTFIPAASVHVDDFSAVTGVAEDLIVRPFQWKGIASNLRNFTVGALDFHFSLQPVEIVGRTKSGDEDVDGDLDGKVAEVSVGNVSALVAFVGMLRPPHEVTPEESTDEVELGRQIFMGQGSENIPSGSQMCAECHAPSLVLDQPIYDVVPLSIPEIDDDPAEEMPAAIAREDAASETIPQPTIPRPATPSLINPIKPERLPINREFQRLQEQLPPPSEREGATLPLSASQVNERVRETMSRITEAPEATVDPEAPYLIGLTNPSLDEDDPMHAVVFPRLPAMEDGRVEVPLYSDLRLHDMGLGLTDVTAQPADAEGVSIPPRLFLTRPLWGVADTDPYLHDGRALTLHDAILGHAVAADEQKPIAQRSLDPSSEAHPAVDAFRNQLSDAERQALIAFLKTLRLPIDDAPEEDGGAAPGE